MQSQPPPKGSLEELFRHHLLESEAAAVPPRPLVWDHIDNSLLLAQNEKYRRRLLVHRWGMAASLLLATLAGGGWWHSQHVATATLASARREVARQAVAGAIGARLTTSNTSAALQGSTATSATTQGLRSTTLPAADAASQAAGAQAGSLAYNEQEDRQPGTSALGSTKLAEYGASRRGRAAAMAGIPVYIATNQRLQGAGAVPARTSTLFSTNQGSIAATATSSFGHTSDALSAVGFPTGGDEATQAEGAYSQGELAATRSGEETLATRLAGLTLASIALPPAELKAKDLPASKRTLLRPWRYSAEYAITAFQPNIDFNRSTTDYNSALGLNTVSLTRAAAAEYRANLKPGLGQRLTLRATRWLGGHWSVGTGLEVAQQEAYSATSAAFTGEQLADFSYANASLSSTGSTNQAMVARELRGSSFRYRSAGIPLELQYDNQAKSGVSFYGRLGAIVSALLSVRSEVASNPEATRTYSITSASTPYRRLTALLRGSAGVRYRPAGHNWGLNVGPAAELGVQSLNAETDRSFLQQSRPYSIGVEAGIEFGSFKPVPTSN